MRRRLVFVAILMGVWCMLTVAVYPQQQPIASHIRSRHRAVLGRWLERRPELRPATAEDCPDREGMVDAQKYWGRNFHPYYAVADFNRDGHEDFAVSLLNRNRPAKLSVAIFNGPFRTSKPAFLLSNLGLDDWLYVQPKNLLLVGPYETDVGFQIKSRGKGYVVRY